MLEAISKALHGSASDEDSDPASEPDEENSLIMMPRQTCMFLLYK